MHSQHCRMVRTDGRILLGNASRLGVPLIVRFIFAPLLGLIAGCGAGGPGAAPAPVAPEQPTLVTSSDGEFAEVEPNDSFASANVLEPARLPEFLIDARMDGPSDVDVFAIGASTSTEVILVQAFGEAATAIRVAVFDGEGNLVARRGLARKGTPTAAFVEATISTTASALYVAVAGAGTAAGASGDAYGLTISRRPAIAGHLPTAPAVYLDFDGAEGVDVADWKAASLLPFTPEGIVPNLRGRRDELIAAITSKVRLDFVGYNVSIVSSSEAAPPAQPFATLYVGGSDPEHLGLSEPAAVDNPSTGQRAIVFADSFAPIAALAPTAEQFAQALANVASHEIGHLLGLVHVAAPADLMDLRPSWRELLADQQFGRADLHGTIFPIGSQDGPRRLWSTIGGAAAPRPTTSTPAATSPGSVVAPPPDSYADSRQITVADATPDRSSLCTCLCDRCRFAEVEGDSGN